MKWYNTLFVNPIVQRILRTKIQLGLAFIAGWLVTKGLTDEAGAHQLVEDFAPIIVAAIWAIYSDIKDEKTLGAALALPSGATKEEARAVAKSPEAPAASHPVDVPVRPVKAP